MIAPPRIDAKNKVDDSFLNGQDPLLRFFFNFFFLKKLFSFFFKKKEKNAPQLISFLRKASKISPVARGEASEVAKAVPQYIGFLLARSKNSKLLPTVSIEIVWFLIFFFSIKKKPISYIFFNHNSF